MKTHLTELKSKGKAFAVLNQARKQIYQLFWIKTHYRSKFQVICFISNRKLNYPQPLHEISTISLNIKESVLFDFVAYVTILWCLKPGAKNCRSCLMMLEECLTNNKFKGKGGNEENHRNLNQEKNPKLATLI